MGSKRPILVTGAPRSGTTWVGRTLATDRSLRYVHEPFNISALPCRCGIRLDHWFHYARADDLALRQDIQHLLASPIHPIQFMNAATAVLSRKHWKDGMKQFKRMATSLRADRALIKDPLAVFSAEWMATQFNMVVIVLIRHPAGFVSSYKALGWTHPFSHFLQQPALLRDYLSTFADEIEAFVLNPRALIEQISLLWTLIYFQVHRYQQAHPEWLFVRYEDLARDPLSGFSKMFEYIDSPFTEAAQRRILATTSGRTPVNNPYSIQRDSRSAVMQWNERLSDDEVVKIKSYTGAISSLFYSEEEWQFAGA